MNQLCKTLFLFLAMVSPTILPLWGTGTQTAAFKLQPGTVIELTSMERGKVLIGTSDIYSQRLSAFDLQSKTERTDSVTEADYLAHAQDNVLAWEKEEVKEMKRIVKATASKIKALGLKLRLPAKIEVVKTTGKEEGGASAYTRGQYIVLATELGEALFEHELFHIFSRYNPEIQAQLYAVLGFMPCKEVPYPESLESLRISNPDAPLNNYYLEVNLQGEPVLVMMVLFASRDYTGGSFFQYLKSGLMMVSGGEQMVKPIEENGAAKVLNFRSVKNFFEQIGRNTGYNIHPEEISAEHFVILLNEKKDIPNPELIEGMMEVLMGE